MAILNCTYNNHAIGMTNLFGAYYQKVVDDVQW